MFQKIVTILKQPHPGYPSLSGYFKTVIAISLVVFLILGVLQPFDIGHSNIYNNSYLTALIYGLGAAGVMSINALWLLVFPSWFKNWTLGKDFLVLLYQVASVGIVIWLINEQISRSGNQGYIKAIFLAFVIGILPYVIITFFKHNRFLQKSLQQAELMNQQLGERQEAIQELASLQTRAKDLLIIVPKQDLKISVSDFLYAESRGNNLHIQWLNNGLLQTVIIRSTINDFAENNSLHLSLFRCHRSYMVNLDKIQQIGGNAAGYQLLLHPDLGSIAVARSYVDAFKRKLEDKK